MAFFGYFGTINICRVVNYYINDIHCIKIQEKLKERNNKIKYFQSFASKEELEDRIN